MTWSSQHLFLARAPLLPREVSPPWATQPCLRKDFRSISWMWITTSTFHHPLACAIVGTRLDSSYSHDLANVAYTYWRSLVSSSAFSLVVGRGRNDALPGTGTDLWMTCLSDWEEICMNYPFALTLEVICWDENDWNALFLIVVFAKPFVVPGFFVYAKIITKLTTKLSYSESQHKHVKPKQHCARVTLCTAVLSTWKKEWIIIIKSSLDFGIMPNVLGYS